ncbi:inc metabolism membrane protein [Malassezia vespertilionis]|uniref:inc metabolism membrane protein n=1 Tax=Malassezia vespertilionis TaxID=2020962 RepID=UPI0024B0E52D|nr:inc metabolism membrane protein [Malassezia vespertilionis]WFD06551.1 inc metabolism membrane protein [Malassezia vespertilionis]
MPTLKKVGVRSASAGSPKVSTASGVSARRAYAEQALRHRVVPDASDLAKIADSLDGAVVRSVTATEHELAVLDAQVSFSCDGRSVVDFLDLSVSLPFWLAYVRAEAKRHMLEIQRRIHLLFERHKIGKTAFSWIFVEIMEQIDMVYHAIPNMAEHLPFAHGARLYSKVPKNKELSRQMQALIADWERRASTFDPNLFVTNAAFSPQTLAAYDGTTSLDQNTLPPLSYAMSLFHFPTGWAEQIQHLPEATAHVATEAWHRLDAFLDRVNNVTLVPLRETSHSLNLGAHIPSRLASLEFPASELLHKFEQTLDTVTERSRAGATGFVHRATLAVQDVEEALYYAAREVANGGKELIHYNALPYAWRNNDFILTGYRFIPLENWRYILKSTFELHNETGNIHTHVLGLAIIIVLYWFSGVLDPHTTLMDRWIQTLYLLAAAKCLLCSISWHIMSGCSNRQWFECFACIDYTGISWLVAASILSLVYNGFYCQPFLIALYSTGSFLLGTIMGVVPWAPWFNDPKNRTIRIWMFIVMALMGIVPFIHGVYLHGTSPVLQFYGPVFPSLLSYIVGVAFYGLRFPERFAPGRFDLIGQSHQLWHVAIVLAICLHYRAILIFHENRFEYSCKLAL